MIVRVVLICLLEIDRSDYIHKGVSFAHKRKKTRKLNNAVLIDANSLTQNMSLTIGVFSFCVKNAILSIDVYRRLRYANRI